MLNDVLPKMVKELVNLQLVGRSIILGSLPSNLVCWDAMSVARNICKHPKLVPGGVFLLHRSRNARLLKALKSALMKASAITFEAIPRSLEQSCGVNVMRTMTSLQGKMILCGISNPSIKSHTRTH